MFIMQIIKNNAEEFKARAAENLLIAVCKLEDAKHHHRDTRTLEIKYSEALAIERAVTATITGNRAVSTDLVAMKVWMLKEMEKAT